ncbi:hypothetical protein [Acinetobacter indicus]|uniref:hypothetical protein n=1 Tax=Acinetobacter indicus TaxID=756892 RepID=UPI002576FFEA|nr:hypothetical protein [Acinetobacter indicus]MDM1245258.1 hypothetical protein [Acinetobacter indicus]MDM1289311.1 hypothetical protein [Acinetobacter indicus]
MRDLFFSLSYNLLTRLILLIISILSVKLLTIAEYGELSYILVIVGTLAIISLFGGGTAVNRSYSIAKKENSFELSNQIFLFNILISLIVSVVLLLISIFFIANLNIAIFTFLIFMFMSLNSILEGAMYGLGKYRQLAINSSIIFMLSIPLGYFLILSYKVNGALLAILLYRIILLVLNLISISSFKIIKLSNLSKVIKNKEVLISFKEVSLPVFLGALLVAPVMLILVTLLKNTPNGINEIAYFSWNNQIYTLAIFIPSILTGFIISKMSANTEDAKEKLINYTKYSFIFGILISIILFLIKPFLLGWAGNDYIENGNDSYNIMLLTILLYCLNSAFGSYWVSINKAKIGLLINLIWAISVLTFCFYTIDIKPYSFTLYNSLLVGYLLIFLAQIIFCFMNKDEVGE